MSTFTKAEAAKLLELLEQERITYGSMLQLTKEQTEHIAADEVEAFEKSLDIRQQLIDKINGLHQGREPLMQSYLSYLEGNNGKKIDRIENMVAEIHGLLTECSQINDENAAKAQEIAKGYSLRISDLNLKKKSIGSYIQNVDNSDFFDRLT